MINLNGRLDEQAALLQASPVATLAAGAWISMKNYRRVTVILDVTNAGAGVTGGAVTLQQATAVAGTSAKALAFTRMKSNIDVAASMALAETPVAANTFTTDATVSKRLRYVLEVDAEALDSANAFDCFRVNIASAVAATGVLSYIVWGARYNGADATID